MMSYRAVNEEEEDYQESLQNDDDLIELFCNQAKFHMMYSSYLRDPSSLNRIVWRLRSLLGQVILITQDFLIENKNLQNFVKIGIPQLQAILNNLLTLQCITRSEKSKANQIKRAIQRIYRQDHLNTVDDFINVFNFCIEIWKEPLQFQLEVTDPQAISSQGMNTQRNTRTSQKEINISDSQILDDEDIKVYESQINEQPEHKINKRLKKSAIMIEDEESEEFGMRRNHSKKKEAHQNATKMQEELAQKKRGRPKGVKNSKTKKGPQNNSNPEHKRNGTQIYTQDESMPPQQVYQGIDYSKKNQMSYPPSSANAMSSNKAQNQKWTTQQQKVLCKTFADLGNERQCYKNLTDQFGQSIKWKTKELILKKIQTLVRRVVDKFKNVSTTNPNVLKFKSNEFFILNQNSAINTELKKLIDRTILVIYCALVDMNNDKAGNREILSKKIIEVNELCNKDFKMNKTIA